jgi:hypothetical protein
VGVGLVSLTAGVDSRLVEALVSAFVPGSPEPPVFFSPPPQPNSATITPIPRIVPNSFSDTVDSFRDSWTGLVPVFLATEPGAIKAEENSRNDSGAPPAYPRARKIDGSCPGWYRATTQPALWAGALASDDCLFC